MSICHRTAIRLLSFAIVAGFISAPVIAQQHPQRDEVLRTRTELIQTYVTVADQKGKFVDGLNREQFQLLIDGQPREISFFDQVTGGVGGSPTNARREDNASTSKNLTNAATLRGRSVVFFVDDLHLSLDSLNRTRKMLGNFLDNEMNPRESIAIVSGSGQMARIFFGRQLALQSLSPGRYDLLISVLDNRSATTATRRTDFQIE